MDKSKIRKTLEEIEDDIQKSWLKDLDKVKELHSLFTILDDILKQDQIENYFENNASDFNYFINKFSIETVNNILRQHYIYGQNGDDIAFQVICQYLRIFLKFIENPNYTPLLEAIKDVFDSSKNYYKGSAHSNARFMNEKKMMSADNYNEMFLPKIKRQSEINENDTIDVLIDNIKPSSFLQDKKVWTRGTVVKVDKENEYFSVNIAEEIAPKFIKMNSLDYLPVGTMTKDYDWRVNLQECKLNNNF